MGYRRVTQEDRIYIKASLDAGVSNITVADKLGFDKSTIGREISRNSGKRGYRPHQAQKKFEKRQESRSHPYKMDAAMIAIVKEKLELKWSPEQISNRLRVEDKPYVSDKTIYNFIVQDQADGGEVWRNLRRSKRRRQRRFPSEDRRGQIKDARPIKKRGRKAKKRKKLGHWERDTMLGSDRKACVLAFVDRKSRYNKFVKMDRRYAKKVTKETIKALRDLPLKSVTNDRGQEFADHKACAKKLKVKIYFCDPYSSYQRGTNENRIGILRQYLPKGFDINKISHQKLRKIEFEINNRPMKTLDWSTPHEIIFGEKLR